MEFSLNKSIEILTNTPVAVSALLNHLSDDWTMNNEGENTWTVKEVVAHLIVCEETNWMPRIRLILDSPESVFAPMNMQEHFEIAQNHPLSELLIKFSRLRESAINELTRYKLREADLLKNATHPVIGKVNLSQLISTWTAHDLTHLAQIARIMARQNKDLVGGFKQYLTLLN